MGNIGREQDIAILVEEPSHKLIKSYRVPESARQYHPKNFFKVKLPQK